MLAVDEPQIIARRVKLMGNQFEISIVDSDTARANAHISAAIAEIERIERLLSTFKPDSETNAINNMAGVAAVKVSDEVFDLIARGIRISDLTQGAFDLTYGSIDQRLWNFDTSMTELPDAQLAKESVRLINYRNIILDTPTRSIFLKNKGMRIGFGGIGKGYAAEMAKKCLIQLGVESGVVNASGDLCAWGTQPDGTPWTIGIADPETRLEAFSRFQLRNMAVATSGDYEKFVVIGGRRFSHTIDPRTGLPVHGIKSVTIIAPHAEIADALTTPVMVMGTTVGLHLINQVNGVACIIVDEQNKIHTSKNINIHSI